MVRLPKGIWSGVREALGLIAGVPSYERYRAHMAACHPDREPKSRGAFFAACQRARYGRGKGRCC
ncbi:YbdD/YjiX family protein [Sphingomonas sp. CJ20]